MVIKRLILTLTLLITLADLTFSQTKMLTGNKHLIFVDIPDNWLQAENEQLPFFIKPNEPNISDKTYQYVYGIDYQSKPDINGWIKGDTDDFTGKHPGVKIDTMRLLLNNITNSGY